MVQKASNRRSPKTVNWVHLMIGIIAVIGLALIGEAERSSTPEGEPQNEYLAFLSPDSLYRHIVGEPAPPANYVAVITLDPDSLRRAMPHQTDQSLSEICKRRLYIANLLDRVSKLQPAVIVLDMWFPPDSCSKENSKELWDAIDLISKSIPVVVGIGTDNLSELVTYQPNELVRVTGRNAILRPKELVARSAIDIVSPDSHQITKGVVELDADSRKIPLSWPVYDSLSTIGNSGQPRQLDSLSIAAVRALDPQRSVLKRVGAIGRNGSPISSTFEFPYTGFLPEQDMPIVAGEDIVCSVALPSDLPLESCSAPANLPDVRKLIRGKVVLIGNTGFSMDLHKSLIGEVAGVVLQANYVESLLRNRVYVPLATIYQVLIGTAWLAIVFWVSTTFLRTRWRLPYLLLAIILPALLLYLAIHILRFYTPLLPTAIVACIFLFITRKTEAILDKQEEAQ
jgi:CHASE2 domain-containing sensor protein